MVKVSSLISSTSKPIPPLYDTVARVLIKFGASSGLQHHRCSRHHRHAPRRVRHKFQVDERRLNRRVPQPARQVVDGDAVHQQMPCVAVAQGVGADMLPRRNRAKFLSASHRRLHPAPCGRDMRLDESALADVPVGQRTTQCPVQLRMHRQRCVLVSSFDSRFEVERILSARRWRPEYQSPLRIQCPVPLPCRYDSSPCRGSGKSTRSS